MQTHPYTSLCAHWILFLKGWLFSTSAGCPHKPQRGGSLLYIPLLNFFCHNVGLKAAKITKTYTDSHSRHQNSGLRAANSNAHIGCHACHGLRTTASETANINAHTELYVSVKSAFNQRMYFEV
jgi:hypothetical protein